MKKYEFTGETISVSGVTLKRIRATKDFGDVKKEELGGFIEKEDNLSHDGDAWVSGNAKVSWNARVCGNAQVSGNAQISGNAQVYGNAQISGDAEVYGNALIYGNSRIYGNARIFNNTHYMTIGPIGSRFDTTTFFKNANNKIFVSCGCFLGSLEEFRKEVERTHGINTRYAKVYQAAADLAEIQILCKEVKEHEMQKDD